MDPVHDVLPHLDALLVLVKLALPFGILASPVVAAVFAGSSYLILGMQYVCYPLFFPPIRHPADSGNRSRNALAFLLYPLYTFVIWVSRLSAVPRVIRAFLNPRPKLGGFIDAGYACCTRVAVLPSIPART